MYCGIFIIFLLNLYILNREVKLSVRIKQSLLVLFLIVSFNLNWLNYIWHGFHDQYGIPNRFAYLYIFLCITMAYQVWNAIKTYRPYQIIWSFGVLVGMVVLSSIYSDEPLAWYNYLLTVLIGLVYFVLFFYYNREERGKLYASSSYSVSHC